MSRFVVVGILFSLASLALTGCSQKQAEAVSKSDFKSKPEQAAYEAALDAARDAIAAVRAEKEIIKPTRPLKQKPQSHRLRRCMRRKPLRKQGPPE